MVKQSILEIYMEKKTKNFVFKKCDNICSFENNIIYMTIAEMMVQLKSERRKSIVVLKVYYECIHNMEIYMIIVAFLCFNMYSHFIRRCCIGYLFNYREENRVEGK